MFLPTEPRAGNASAQVIGCLRRPTSLVWLVISLAVVAVASVAVFIALSRTNPVELAAQASPPSGVYGASLLSALDPHVEPVAAFTFAKAGGPFEIIFDASPPDDPDGAIVDYKWDFGDGQAGFGQQVVHQYRRGGAYTVQLTVTNELDDIATTAADMVLERTFRILDAEMRSASVFAVTVESEFHGEGDRQMVVTLVITSASSSTVLAVLEGELHKPPAGQSETRINFDFVAENVPRFSERVRLETTVLLRETLPDGRVMPLERASLTKTLPIPVIITHGIMGDLAPLEYDSFGPGMPNLAALLMEDGYSESRYYPTMDQLIYPSLHPGGVEYLAWKYMRPAVDRLLERTHADKVDIVAHSMGGIVARVYVELLRGSENVSTLVTLGTPHEGAAKAHSAFAGYGSHEPEDTPAATLMSMVVRQHPEYEPLLTNDLFVETMAEVGVKATVQLLPDYPYYTELGPDGVPPQGPGWPTDPGMDLQRGKDGLLGPNELLLSLNTRGFAKGVEYFQVYSASRDTRTGIVMTSNGDGAWGQYTVMSPGDGTVPVRSLLLEDYPDLNAQLWKCRVDGSTHKLMFEDALVREQVRLVLQRPATYDSAGCVR